MRVASVVFASPLPQLDKEFDYFIPSSLDGLIQFGSMVSVPFGKSKTTKTGYVVSIKDESEFGSELASIASVESCLQLVTPEQYALCKAIAKRQAGLVGELLSTAVPKRSVRAEKNFANSASRIENPAHSSKVSRSFVLPGLLDAEHEGHWSTLFAKSAAEYISKGKGVLVVVPDFRDMEELEKAIDSAGLAERSVRISSEDTLTQRWLAHLKATAGTPLVTYGTRGAIFAPSANLGAILVWDDGDDSHIEQSSPYWNTRDVALSRSELEHCDIIFASHAPSAEVARLIEIGYLTYQQTQSQTPPVRISETSERLDEESFALISRTLSANKPVLIQVSNLGYASAIVCLKCKEIRRCSTCQTALWIDPTKTARCRSCKQSYSTQCSCGGSNYRPISVGSKALTDQLSRSFPNATVLHTSGAERVTNIERKGILVIATPGAEPSVEGGYELIVFADSLNMVGLPRLRALENACSKWANALAKCSKTGLVIYVGITGRLADKLRSSDFMAIVREDAVERMEIGLPPASRTLSISSASKNALSDIRERLLIDLPEARLISETATSIAYTYSIATGIETAEKLVSITSEMSRASKKRKPGQRVFFVNMDDNKVI
jgi:primosomal protein N' (replication factor Y)